MSKEITDTERLISEIIRKGTIVKVFKDGSYSMEWSKATQDIYNLILMLADTNMILKVAKQA